MAAVVDALDAVDGILRRSYEHLAGKCIDGSQVSAVRLDEHQLVCYDLAWCSARLAAARAMVKFSESASNQLAVHLGKLFVAESLQDIVERLSLRPLDYGLAC